MTEPISIEKCKRCVRFRNGQCPLDDLEPCHFIPKKGVAGLTIACLAALLESVLRAKGNRVMKAPLSPLDKIFVNKVEYVRKDLLADWLREQISVCENLKEKGYGDVFYSAEIDALECVVGKLNEL